MQRSSRPIERDATLRDRQARRRLIAEALRDVAARHGARIVETAAGPRLEGAHEMPPPLRVGLARAVVEFARELEQGAR